MNNTNGTFTAYERIILESNDYVIVQTWTGNETCSNGEWCITARATGKGFWLHRNDGEGPVRHYDNVNACINASIG